MKIKLTWRDIFKAHVHTKKGLFKDELDVWEREAKYLNKIIKRKLKRKRA